MSEDVAENRVDDRELVIDFDRDDIYTHHGEPFTGMSYSLFPNGTLCAEGSLIDGMETGYFRSWYSNGQIKEDHPPYNIEDRTYREWHKNGRLAVVGRCKFEKTIERKKWDEVGNVSEHWLASGVTPQIPDQPKQELIDIARAE